MLQNLSCWHWTYLGDKLTRNQSKLRSLLSGGIRHLERAYILPYLERSEHTGMCQSPERDKNVFERNYVGAPPVYNRSNKTS